MKNATTDATPDATFPAVDSGEDGLHAYLLDGAAGDRLVAFTKAWFSGDAAVQAFPARPGPPGRRRRAHDLRRGGAVLRRPRPGHGPGPPARPGARGRRPLLHPRPGHARPARPGHGRHRGRRPHGPHRPARRGRGVDRPDGRGLRAPPLGRAGRAGALLPLPRRSGATGTTRPPAARPASGPTCPRTRPTRPRSSSARTTCGSRRSASRGPRARSRSSASTRISLMKKSVEWVESARGTAAGAPRAPLVLFGRLASKAIGELMLEPLHAPLRARPRAPAPRAAAHGARGRGARRAVAGRAARRGRPGDRRREAAPPRGRDPVPRVGLRSDARRPARARGTRPTVSSCRPSRPTTCSGSCSGRWSARSRGVAPPADAPAHVALLRQLAPTSPFWQMKDQISLAALVSLREPPRRAIKGRRAARGGPRRRGRWPPRSSRRPTGRAAWCRSSRRARG